MLNFAHLFSAKGDGAQSSNFNFVPTPIISEKKVEVHRGESCITFDDHAVV